MRTNFAFLVPLSTIILAPLLAFAQWQLDGGALATAANDQYNTSIVADGAGGAIVTWQDYRSGTNFDIYAQRVNALGVPQWAIGGVVISAAAGDQYYPTITSDGAGGAIVTWYDYRSGTPDIYARRVNASGTPQWTADGVPLCTAVNIQSSPAIVSDGAGGAIVTWQDRRSGTNNDVYVQRVNAAGAPQWTANGVAVSVAVNDQYGAGIVSDAAGGAVIAWQDLRSGINFDIYTQRLNASGVPLWTANGVALSTAANDQVDLTIASDNAGGAIVTWYDYRSGTGTDIYARRVNAGGVPQWTADGVVISTAANSQWYPTIVADGAGGAIVTWQDYRNGSNFDIYAQRVNAAGEPRWGADGVALSMAWGDQLTPTIVSDGAGGAIVTWYDYRSGSNSDVYAQRVNPSGVMQWMVDGVVVSTAVMDQFAPEIASDGAGGAIVAWYDNRSSAGYDVYAQRVEARYGYWGHPEPIVTSVADIAHDQGGKVAVNWTASGRDLPSPRAIGHYSVWRAVNTLPIASDGTLLTDISRVESGARGPLFAKLPAADYYWELVGTESAHGWPGYSYSASTRADSMASAAGTEFFMVAAHVAWDDYIAFASNVGSGHSVDNLSPAAPDLLVAERVGADVQLHWNRVHAPDLRDYAVYRATSSGLKPVLDNFLSSADDSLWIDTGAPANALYYVVTANDAHGNQGPPSNEASVNALTHAGSAPIARLAILDNMPNPFAATTTMRVGLPKASEVEIDVFDVAGRLVRSERTHVLPAGWREVAFEASGEGGRPLPSGVYFYRVRAAGETMTRKMVIAR